MICNECKKEFVPRRNTKGKYCSLKCYRDSRPKQKIYNCCVCHKEVTRKDSEVKRVKFIYCSIKCLAIHKSHKIRKYNNCLNCNSKLKKNNKKFCSYKCSATFQSNELITQWLTKKISGGDKYGHLKQSFRNYLLRQADYKCTQCGWGEVNPSTNKPILAVDHIDGNWKNNDHTNLRVICYNCHTLTLTFGSLNKNGLSYERLLQQRKARGGVV